jgi:hypothetical protein
MDSNNEIEEKFEIIKNKINKKLKIKFIPIRKVKIIKKLSNWLILVYVSLFIIKFTKRFSGKEKIVNENKYSDKNTVDESDKDNDESSNEDDSYGDIDEIPKKTKDRKKDTVYKRMKKNEDEYYLCKWDGKEIRYICGYNNICLSRPSYGNKNKNARRCIKHKDDGMKDVTHIKCNHESICDKQPTFGYENGKAERCSMHRGDRIDIKSKRCNHEFGCKTQPSFGYEEDGKSQRCSSHREKNMIDVRSKKCNYKDCKKHPSFGYSDDGKSQRCSGHKEEDMIDVKSTYCNHSSGCKIRPSYGYEDDSKAQRCSKHSEEDMVDVKSCICNHPDGCKTHASYGYEENGKKQRCSKHKEENMINVKNKRCDHISGCKTHPSFGYKKDGKKQRCSKHKEENMINVALKICNFPDCDTSASFGYKNEGNTLTCFEHKIIDMVDINHKKCIKCELTISKHKKYCNPCFRELYPDDSNVRKYRIIELYFHHNLFNVLYPNIQNNKRIFAGKSSRRPDWLLEFKTHNVILECDENGHKYYSKSDENIRIRELYEDSKKPIIIIKFNPHKYTDEYNKKYVNCFGFDDMHKLIVNLEEFDRRSKIIKEKLIKAQDKPLESITIISLFMD